jgi:DnaJ-class molecular chaperone
MESEKVIAFGEELELKPCSNCKGSGNAQEWDRKEQKHVENPDYHCEICKGSRYVVVSKRK